MKKPGFYRRGFSLPRMAKPGCDVQMFESL